MVILKTVAKITVSAILLWFLFRSLDGQAVIQLLANADLVLIAGTIAALLGLTALGALRWQMIATGIGVQMSYSKAFELVLIGMFFNQVLPSSVGGDAYRAWALRSLSARLSKSVNSVLIDRAFALASTLIVLTAGLPLLLKLVPAGPQHIAIQLLIGLGCAGLLLVPIGLSLFPRLRVRGFLARSIGYRFVHQVASDVVDILKDPARSGAVLALSLVVNASVSLAVWALARSLGVDPDPWGCIVVVPLVMLISMLPVSIAGWGIREGGMVVGLGLLGIRPATALSASVLFGLSIMAIGLIGGVVWLAAKRPKPQLPAAGS